MPKCTWLLEGLKLEPLMTTVVPVRPAAGDSEVSVGSPAAVGPLEDVLAHAHTAAPSQTAVSAVLRVTGIGPPWSQGERIDRIRAPHPTNPPSTQPYGRSSGAACPVPQVSTTL